MPNDDDVNRLTSLIPWLNQQGYDVANLSYPLVREKAQGGAILAHQGTNFLWRFKRRDTAAIAAALGLKRRAPEGPPPADHRSLQPTAA